jgi:S1-C subfamily serine protease
MGNNRRLSCRGHANCPEKDEIFQVGISARPKGSALFFCINGLQKGGKSNRLIYMQNYQKNIIIVLGVLSGGVIGGLIFQWLIFPYLLGNSYFSQFQLIRDFKEGKVIINTKEEVTVQENVALQNAMDKVGETVVGIKTKTEAGATLQGSGVIATTDGLVVTLADFVPDAGAVSVILNGVEITPKIIKRDFTNDLALLKIPNQNLKTCGFCSAQDVKLGERVFLLGVIPVSFEKSANEGIIKSFDENIIKTNIFDSYFLKGSPLFNTDGNLVGLNLVDSAGRVSAIPISMIKAFAGF